MTDPTPKPQTAAEPFGAVTYDLTGCEHFSRDVALVERIAAAGSNGPTEVLYLYVAPPAEDREMGR